MHRITYANVVATLALFVALGGSSYAAITISGKNVKDGSLTGKDIKNNSLGGADIKNGTLGPRDFKNADLPDGPQGPKGPQGPQGPKGDQGPPANPASVPGYSAVNETDVNLLDQSTVVKLNLPPGKYLLSASAQVQNWGSSSGYQGGTTPVDCQIPGFKTETQYLSVNGVYGNGQITTFSLDSSINHSGGEVRLTCNTTWNEAKARSGSLNAVQVGSLN